MDQIQSITSDYGVEHLIGDMCFDGRCLWPHWNEMDLIDDSHELNGDDCGVVADTVVNFTGSMKVPGCEHICANALNQALIDVGPRYKAWLSKARHVAKFLRSGLYTDKLLYTCFSGADLRERNAVHTQVSDLIKKGVAFPYTKKFGSLVKFWHNVKPWRGLLLRYFRPEVFEGMGAPGDDDSDVDDKEQDMGKVKMAKASSAMLDRSWWAYGECVAAIFEPVDSLMFFNRTCPCHPPDTFQCDDTVRLKWQAKMKAETGYNQCPACGLQAPFFAVGKHMEVLAESSRGAYAKLLSSLCDISAETRGHMVEDYEKGSNSLTYVLQLKYSSFQQLPLLLCGMAHPLESVARGIAKDVVEQFTATATSCRQHPKVRELCSNGSQLNVEFHQFMAGESRDALPHFKQWLMPLRLVRTNELSVERLHKVGTVAKQRASWHKANYVSCRLRAPELQLAKYSLQTLAACCERTRHEGLVLKEFKLCGHEVVRQWQDVQLASGVSCSGQRGMHKVIR